MSRLFVRATYRKGLPVDDKDVYQSAGDILGAIELGNMHLRNGAIASYVLEVSDDWNVGDFADAEIVWVKTKEDE